MAKLFTRTAERAFAVALSRLVYANPFLPERIQYEREALAEEFSAEAGEVWAASPVDAGERPNVARLQVMAEALAMALRARLAEMESVDPEEARLYTDVVHYVLYYRTWRLFDPILADSAESAAPIRITGYRAHAEAYRFFFEAGPYRTTETSEHVFALYYQIRRAFQCVFRHILGASMPVARLRAGVWQSIFTCDLAAYRASLFEKLATVPTLIMGESGTGKELVARAVALSRYIPFDPAKEQFVTRPSALYMPLNLSALAPTLIESELFGHRRGAFTGALEDRVGWLENCPPRGSVFLDEIGELDGLIQVKLLRVLQARTFQRAGETQARTFAGKIIAATNRDLAAEMEASRFRRDLYYRLCADMITTPALAEQLQGASDTVAELRFLVRFVAQRVAGVEMAEALTDRVVAYVRDHVGLNYRWPGNFRELEQCVRNVLIRREYRPMGDARTSAATPATPAQRLAQAIERGTLTADQLVDAYAAMTYAREGTYGAAARRLGLDRRTIKARVDRHAEAQANWGL